MYEIADEANLRYNCFPSLHVAGGVACLDVYTGKARLVGKLLLWLWAAGLTLSTLLLHQHHLIDAGGGLLLAWLGSRVLYPRLARVQSRKPRSACESQPQ